MANWFSKRQETVVIIIVPLEGFLLNLKLIQFLDKIKMIMAFENNKLAKVLLFVLREKVVSLLWGRSYDWFSFEEKKTARVKIWIPSRHDLLKATWMVSTMYFTCWMASLSDVKSSKLFLNVESLVQFRSLPKGLGGYLYLWFRSRLR